MLPNKNNAVLTITELTKSIKSVLESQYRFVHIRGQVSNLRIPYSGHMYFTLKDSESQIKAVLFKGQSRYLSEKIEEGQSIICHGRISLYEPRGEYQIIIDTVDFKGVGDLQIQYEVLKKQLEEEGLFNRDQKKQLMPYPEQIFVITSPTGAAVHDFLKIAEKRNFWGKTTIFPVAVQGKNAATEIANAIETINDTFPADIIVLIRGGGSLEDLWSFNEEVVARAIHQSNIPIVTGIGHETDTAIADLCADLHTHTPTAAAEAIIADSKLVQRNIALLTNIMANEMRGRIEENEETVARIRRIIGNLDLYLSNYNLKLDYQISAIMRNMSQFFEKKSSIVELLSEKLYGQAPSAQITMQSKSLENLKEILVHKMSFLLEKKKSHLGKYAAIMDSVSPLAILGRGYSIVSKKDVSTDEMSVISSTAQVESGESIDVRLHQGTLKCEVVEKKDN